MDQLGLNLPWLVAQLVNFGIFYLILSRFVLPPVMRILEERKAKIDASLQRVEQLNVQAQETRQAVDSQLADARKESQEIVNRALQTAERVRAEAEGEARKSAEAVLARAQDEIRLERDRAIQELRREFADVAIAAAERVVRQSLDKPRHAELIERTLAESPTFRVN